MLAALSRRRSRVQIPSGTLLDNRLIRHGTQTGKAAKLKSWRLRVRLPPVTRDPKMGLLTAVRIGRKLLWHKALAGVAEWQTRWTQNPVAARQCGFKSHLRYLILSNGLRDSLCSSYSLEKRLTFQ